MINEQIMRWSLAIIGLLVALIFLISAFFMLYRATILFYYMYTKKSIDVRKKKWKQLFKNYKTIVLPELFSFRKYNYFLQSNESDKKLLKYEQKFGLAMIMFMRIGLIFLLTVIMMWVVSYYWLN